MIDLLAARS